jgi:hypothetical protein
MRITSVSHHTAKISLSTMIVGSILGVGALPLGEHVHARGVIAPESPVQPLVLVDAGLPIAFDGPYPGDITNVWDYELLKFFEYICIILMCQDPADGMDAFTSQNQATLATTALIDRYRTQGLMPNLSAAEIAQGQIAVQTVLTHLRTGRGTPGSLQTGLAAELDATLVDMLDELSSLRGTTAGGQ